MIFFRTLSDLSLILYFATDHPLYFNNIGFWKYDKKFTEYNIRSMNTNSGPRLIIGRGK